MLAELADSLFRRDYRPCRPRWVDIPKHDSSARFRRIGILTIRDRIVRAAVKQVLDPILEPIFLPNSFGFRVGRSVDAALDAASWALSAPTGEKPKLLWASPLDVENCFPTLDHEHVGTVIAEHIADAELFSLIQQLVATGGETIGRLWWQRRCGLIQDSALSPLLCNLALHSLDVTAAKIGQDTQAGVAVMRYADDMLVLARDANLVNQAITALRGVLARQHQRFKRIPAPRPAAAGVDWLGVTLRPRPLAQPDSTIFGYVVPVAKIESMLTRLHEMTAPPSDKIDAAAFNMAKWIVSVNSQLRDWRQAYLFADNAPDLFRLLDDVARERIGCLLKTVSGLSWTEIRRNHFAMLPRGFWTWEVPGARLTVLSSLAPHAPRRLIRRPIWWTDRTANTVRGS